MKARLKIVIIPGIGDDLDVYNLFAKRWLRLGYEVYVIPFGWYESTALRHMKHSSFLKKLDALGDGPLYLIGVSAGGPAAINVMAERGNVHKVITVSSPLDTIVGLRNPLLAESIKEAKKHLSSFTPDQKRRVLSVYGLYDPVVATNLSSPEGIETLRVAMVMHPSSIFVALMLYVRKLNKFLKTAT